MTPLKGTVLIIIIICGYFIVEKVIEYALNNLVSKREGGVCEGIYINQLKALESRVAFLELKECDIKDFIEYGYDALSRATVAKSEKDYGAKIRVGKKVLYRQQITQTNQKYYEYDNQMEKAFKDIRRSDWNGGRR